MDYPEWGETRYGMWAAERDFPMIDDETPTFMGRPHAKQRADLDGADAVIIGAPYVSSSSDEWAGVGKEHWLAAPQRVRQQSIRYQSGPAPGDIMGELAEPIGMNDYEVIRIAHELGLRGIKGFSFICIPPGSPVIYRLIVYIVMYLLVGKVMSRR